ncbi:TetR/AcrR family transcriptional regulator [Gordonia sp. NPDC003429]
MSVDERRAALIESAYRVIADHGVEGATTRRICAHAGMPLASFHYAFESRTALLSAVMETAVPRDIQHMLDIILDAQSTPPGEGAAAMRVDMFNIFDAFYTLLKADPGRLQATISLGIYAHNHPELHRVGRQMYENLYAVAAQGLKAAALHCGAEWMRPVDELGPVIIATTTSITLIYLSAPDDAVVATVIELAVNQLATYVR